MSAYTADLLAHATRLLGAKSHKEVLALTCREAQRLAGVDLLFCSFGTSATWAAGFHQRRLGSGQADATPAQRSALFAVHRALSRQPGPAALARAAEPTVFAALCGADHPSCVIVAFPIAPAHRALVGCLVLCGSDALEPAVEAAVAELAHLAAAALDNVQRISSARRDRERLSLLAEAAEEALWDWSPDSGEFWWGGGVQTLLGDVVVQSRLSWKFEQIHPDDVERVRRSFDRALAAPAAETWSDEYRQRRTDGSWLQVEEHVHILRDSEGRPHRVVGALRDVTELRALLQRENVARKQAENASLAKDEFLAMLGHELRNPLSPIMSALHLLRKRPAPEVADKGLMIIERQARHLTRLVDDLLDISRIASGKVRLDRERVDLAEVIRGALETTNPLIEERRHTVESRIDGALEVDADRARMQQVIGNLLANAAKYTPPGGRIIVHGRSVEAMVEVRIADSGIGIAHDMLPRVFDTFVQSRQSLDRAGGGLGLGLAIVRNLVQLHGGTVEARSEGEGRGSEFVVRLPAATSSRPTSEATKSSEAQHGVRRRVLVVDDNQDSAESLAMLLDQVGHATRVVHDGVTALTAVEEFEPDVVLLDLGLPRMDGYEVARRLRERHGGKRFRLVAVTGYGQDSDRVKTRAAGFDMHLVKPVAFEHLHETIGAATPADSPGR